MVARYYSRQVVLHGECFYNGLCDPIEDTVRRIRETVRLHRRRRTEPYPCCSRGAPMKLLTLVAVLILVSLGCNSPPPSEEMVPADRDRGTGQD